MKIYTRTGDQGETGLFGGGRVAKDDLRVQAYGSVDEANAALGVARAALRRQGGAAAALDEDLEALQGALFDLGADLATPLDARARQAVRPVAAADVEALERRIDALDDELEPLGTFILPGGSDAAAALHVARAVARRAERDTVALARVTEVNPEALRYLNRLSDLLFTLARAVNARSGVPDAAWGRGARER
ncbi:MAG: cob(I)yrinic acid a,c-diamide adenosyltransferase [Deinococcales bacterium]